MLKVKLPEKAEGTGKIRSLLSKAKQEQAFCFPEGLLKMIDIESLK